MRRVRRVTYRRPVRTYRRRVGYTRRSVRHYRPYRVRRAFYRRKQIGRRIQNDVKFSCKSYEQSILDWNLPANVGKEGPTNWQKYQRNLSVGLFFEKNRQFAQNLLDYHWIKFNYIAVKVVELNYYGYTDLARDGRGNISQISGFSAMNFDNMPMYFMWDLEQDMSWDNSAHITVDPESLSQYQFAKKMYPKNHRGITFMWRFPKPWRQYINTYVIRDQSSLNSWSVFMSNITNIKNYRSPHRLMGTHQNPFVMLSLPIQPGTGLKGKTVIALKFYLGVSFRGRAVQGQLLPGFSEEKVDQVVKTDHEF